MTTTGGQLGGVPLQPGAILAGKYRVERVLGEGAMGVVVLAMHVHLGERVALKFLKPELRGEGEIVQRFLREAQSAVRIKGEHVARVSDVGTLEDGAPYMVMEYLQGSDLGELLEKHGKMDVPMAVDCVIQACEALAEAHSLGIVHRDLKPSNLFLTKRADGSPLVKVLDFGIAKLLNNDPSKPPLTAMGAVLGSPVYMSPEQILGKKTVDHRSDVWQLGVILYELLAGHVPFDGNSLSEIMIAIGVNPPKPLRQVRPDAPPEIEALVAKALEKDPANRLPYVAAIAEGLLPFATTKRAHVSVEHVVTLLRGSVAAQALPPMRPSMQSAPGYFERASVVPAMPPGASKEPSNPYAQTVAGGPPMAAHAPPPQQHPPQATHARDDRMAQTVARGPEKSNAVMWIAAAMVAIGVLLAVYALALHTNAQQQAPAPAPVVTAPKK